MPKTGMAYLVSITYHRHKACPIQFRVRWNNFRMSVFKERYWDTWTRKHSLTVSRER